MVKRELGKLQVMPYIEMTLLTLNYLSDQQFRNVNKILNGSESNGPPPITAS